MIGQIGKYEILRKIGTGGFGTVYEARDPLIERRVALKTCEVTDPANRARFFQEARLGGSLRHRNITTVFDFGVDGDTAYIVQELLDGEDLDRTILRRPGLSLLDKLRILLGAAYGLEAAHHAGVLHGDVKPGNIRVLEDGTVKLMDFGIARSVGVRAGHTSTGVQIGTLAYLAPERVLEQPIDVRSDVFSFGVVAYELLSGRRPFPGDTQEDLFDQIVHDQPPPLESIAPEVPPMLAAVVRRAMEKDPAARYGDMEGVRKDLLAVHYSLFRDPADSPGLPAAVGTGSAATTRELRDQTPPDPREISAPPPIASVNEYPPPTSPTPPAPAAPRPRGFSAAVAASAVLLALLAVFVFQAAKKLPARAPAPSPVAESRTAAPARIGDRTRAVVPAVELARKDSEASSPESALLHTERTGAAPSSPRASSAPPPARPSPASASRWARAAQEPGLSPDTRAAIYVSGAWERYRAGDPEAAQRLLGSALAWRSDLTVDARRYDAGFVRLADRARAARRTAS
ncbi:MAG: serine/threonine-protein kinase [Acidobacteriota bacterium]